jgi:hypothetical protein
LTGIFTHNNPTKNNRDWVPGDWGYIKNTNFKAPGDDDEESFEQGENIYYLGGSFRTDLEFISQKAWWGLTSAGSSIKGLDEWQKEVFDWNKGQELLESRRGPAVLKK